MVEPSAVSTVSSPCFAGTAQADTDKAAVARTPAILPAICLFNFI